MSWVNAVVHGILLGGVYALLATGLSLMFGVMRIINLAHGSLALVGVGLATGIFNATLIRILRLPSIIATLATLSILDGISLTLRPTAQGVISPDFVSVLTATVGPIPVAFIVKRLLERRGANVVLTRTTPAPVDLQLRPTLARRANAHALVSLHYNAYGDGINPLVQPNGTETYFFRPHAEPLARAVQGALAALQPLPDQGVYYRSLAIARTTWMPSILVEGGFIIIPEQENAMKTEPFQERYARAIVDGLETYFRALRIP